MDTSKYFNNDYEKNLLAAYLNDPDKLLISQVKPEHLYNSKLKRIFEAMIAAQDEGKEIDPVSLYESLNKEIPLTELVEMEQQGSMERHYVKTYEETILTLYKNRTLRTALQEYLVALEEGEGSDSIATKMQSFEFAGTEDKVPIKPIGEFLMEAIETVERKTTGEYESIKSGWSDLDYTIGNFTKGRMFLVAGRPGMGKTVFNINLARSLAKNNKVLFFSIEMKGEQLANRILSAESGVNGMALNNAVGLNSNDINKIAMAASKATTPNLWIDETGDISISEIKNKIKVHKKKYGVDVVIIDHLLKIKEVAMAKDIRTDTTIVARALSEFAKTLDVNIILLTQLSRAPEQRADHRPILSDLKETGALEEEASVVMFLYRDEYYNEETEIKNTLEVIIAKNREGQMGTVEMYCDLSTQSIKPLFRR